MFFYWFRYSPQHPSMMGGGPPRGAPGGVRGAGNSMRTMGRGDYGKFQLKCTLRHGKAWLCDLTSVY